MNARPVLRQAELQRRPRHRSRQASHCMQTRLWIVVVNFRTAQLVADCLRSVAPQRDNGALVRLLVVDNASGDGSPATLERLIRLNGWSDWASVLSLPRNGGFAYGNNAGIRIALESGSADYVMLLNPDTTCRPGAIRSLVEFMDANPRAGIAGGLLESASGAPVQSAHNSVTPLGELEAGARLGALSRAMRRYAVSPPSRECCHECDWVSGAALIVRRAVFDRIGLLDEGFFLYFEEVDFCSRARRAGWQVWFVPESRIVHLEGASTGISDTQRRRPRYWFEARRRYFVKHHGVLGLLLADALWLLGRGSLALRRALRLGSGGPARDPVGFTSDVLLGDLRALVKGELWRISRARERTTSASS